MNSKNITKYLIACSLCCGGAAAFDGCADWDDHYDANSELLDTQQSTLWENIANTDNLSQFASLLKKADYDAVLNASQTYTVWAPVNGSFDYETLNAFSAERLRKEFIENHIARSNYPASGVLATLPIYTLNEKLSHFNGDLYYDMQGVSVVRPNLASENGTIHVLGGKIPYVQNIYESLNVNEYIGIGFFATMLSNCGLAAAPVAFFRLLSATMMLALILLAKGKGPSLFRVSRKGLISCMLVGFISQALGIMPLISPFLTGLLMTSRAGVTHTRYHEG